MKKLVSLFIILISSSLFAQTIIDSTNIYSFNYAGNKYEIVKQAFTWEAAAKIADERGGILAEINSQDEQDSIFKYLSLAEIDISKTIAPDGGNASYVWIGGNDIDTEGSWFWDGNYDKLGKQFWEGTTSGNVVGELYNNWGNEPDNFSNQDALGLAITNWPRGIAGEWNDVQDYNNLYFIIEYDNSTFKAEKFESLYHLNQLRFVVDFKFSYDSVQVVVDSVVTKTFFNVGDGSKVLESYYYPNKTKIIQTYLKAYRDAIISYSNPFNFDAFAFTNPISTYSTDFENVSTDDFMSEGFTISLTGGFRNKAIHSPHKYDNNMDYKITFTKPIIVDSVNSKISYTDVAIVEPGESGSVFGENEFKDYVVIEGLKKNEVWKPLQNGYDSNLYPDWLTAWGATTLYRNLYKRQNIELTNTYGIGDTILIRFRLHSDDSTNGWGWVIDSLQIQDFAVSVNNGFDEPIGFNLEQNYPNPFNPSTTIKYSIPSNVKSETANTKLTIYDVLGREVSTLVNKQQKVGNYEVKFDASNLSSGIYFYKLTSEGYISSKKMLLLR